MLASRIRIMIESGYIIRVTANTGNLAPFEQRLNRNNVSSSEKVDANLDLSSLSIIF